MAYSIGDIVKVPFLVNARGDHCMVDGVIDHFYGINQDCVSVNLIGCNKGYSVSGHITMLDEG